MLSPLVAHAAGGALALQGMMRGVPGGVSDTKGTSSTTSLHGSGPSARSDPDLLAAPPAAADSENGECGGVGQQAPLGAPSPY